MIVKESEIKKVIFGLFLVAVVVEMGFAISAGVVYFTALRP